MIISLKPHYSVVPDVKLPEKLTRLKLETVDLSITDSPPAFTTSRPDSPGKSKNKCDNSNREDREKKSCY